MLRGGRKFVIASRNGVRTGYQAWKIRHWKSYGATITITTDDATKPEGVKVILEKALALGPVAAIFNLAVVSVTSENFHMLFVPYFHPSLPRIETDYLFVKTYCLLRIAVECYSQEIRVRYDSTYLYILHLHVGI